MNTVAIITARSKSTRLPNKVLAPINDKPMLWHIVGRVRQSIVNNVVVATVEGDDKVINFCKGYEIDYYAGSENDILDRLYQTAKQFKADIIARIWGDSPLIEAKDIDEVISYQNAMPTYFTRYTAGGAVSVMRLDKLAKAWFTIKEPKEREWIHKTLAERGNAITEGSSLLSFTVDTQEDLDKVRGLYAGSQGSH